MISDDDDDDDDVNLLHIFIWIMYDNVIWSFLKDMKGLEKDLANPSPNHISEFQIMWVDVGRSTVQLCLAFLVVPTFNPKIRKS